MSRYVDLDEIVDAMYYDEEHEEWNLEEETIESALGHVDSFNVFELVRCRDCKWYRKADGRCSVWCGCRKEEGFCDKGDWRIIREEDWKAIGENCGFPSKEEADLWMNAKPVGKEEI